MTYRLARVNLVFLCVLGKLLLCLAAVLLFSGASGFIATQLVKQLLEKGYTVRGTVRSTKDEAKTQVLHALAAALPGNLELHEADLLQEDTFDSVIKGAAYVFHSASPFFSTAEDPQQDVFSSFIFMTSVPS